MDEKKRKWLEWFFDFVNLDVNSLTVGGRRKWGLELAYMLTGYFYKGIDGTAKYDLEDLDLWGSEALNFKGIASPASLQALQTSLRDFLEEMTKRIEQAPVYEEQDWKPSDRIETSYVLGRIQLNTVIQVQAPVELESKFEGKTLLTGQSFYRWEPEALKKATISLTSRSQSYGESLLFHFVKSLEGVPLASIRRCPECGNWFLHTSKRDRIFCSNRCAARKISRDRREQIREKDLDKYQAELGKGRRRARKSYEKKIKAVLGPKVKVDRRPRKHKAGCV